MYCPKCGNADQVADTFCRQCGVLLPDFSGPAKRPLPPEEHLKANTVLNALTILTAVTLIVLLLAILGFKEDTHPLIYVTCGLLTAITSWHIQTLIRTILLRKQWGTQNASARTDFKGGASAETRIDLDIPAERGARLRRGKSNPAFRG